MLRQELHAVANAEDGHAELEEARIETRRLRCIRTLGAAGEDETFGFEGAHTPYWRLPRQNLGVHAQAPHAPRDELRGLGTEVQDHDGFVCGHGIPYRAEWNREWAREPATGCAEPSWFSAGSAGGARGACRSPSGRRPRGPRHRASNRRAGR